jgi:hypothetical protein
VAGNWGKVGDIEGGAEMSGNQHYLGDAGVPSSASGWRVGLADQEQLAVRNGLYVGWIIGGCGGTYEGWKECWARKWL